MVALVRAGGLEPPLPYGKRILSPPRLPFRHARRAGWVSTAGGRSGQGIASRRSPFSMPRDLRSGARSGQVDSPRRKERAQHQLLE